MKPMTEEETGTDNDKKGASYRLIDQLSGNRYWRFIGGFSGFIALLALLFTFIGPKEIINFISPKDALAVKLLKVDSLPAVYLLPDHVEEGSTVYVSSNASLADASQIDLLLSAINQSSNQIRVREDNVLIQVNTYVPIDRIVNIWHHYPELGAGYDWLFGVNLDSDSLGLVKAEYIGSDNIDSIFINPKEEEHIRVLISFSEPGIYTFEIVFQYFHHGELNKVSLEDILTITVPAEFTSWNGEINWETRDISDLKIGGYCKYNSEIETGLKWMSNYECSYDN